MGIADSSIGRLLGLLTPEEKEYNKWVDESNRQIDIHNAMLDEKRKKEYKEYITKRKTEEIKLVSLYFNDWFNQNKEKMKLNDSAEWYQLSENKRIKLKYKFQFYDFCRLKRSDDIYEYTKFAVKLGKEFDLHIYDFAAKLGYTKEKWDLLSEDKRTEIEFDNNFKEYYFKNKDSKIILNNNQNNQLDLEIQIKEKELELLKLKAQLNRNVEK